MSGLRFWEEKPLSEMSAEEWESLCDGCGKCCLHKLECEDTLKVYYTDVACRYLDIDTCRCQDYSLRLKNVPGCLSLDKDIVGQLSWLPSSCAYRLVAENKPLPEWHHLKSQDRQLIHRVGASVSDWAVSELGVSEDDMEERVILFVD